MPRALPLALVALALALALALTLAPRPSAAHTRLYYYPLQATIRNAETRQGDGAFSVAGVCGGVRRWANRGFTNVNNGQRVCARVNWNGGHKVRENRWKALFKCNRPDQEIDIQNAPQIPFVAGTNPAPETGNMTVYGGDANGVWDGYTVCVDLPVQDLAFQATDQDMVNHCDNPTRACTLSITDQRNWGGCLDLCLRDNYTDLVPRTTLAPNDPRLFAPISVPKAEGVYRVVDCDASSGGRCCLEGFVAVTKDGKVGARLRGNSGQSNCYDLQYYGWQDYQFTMRAVPFTNSSFQGNFFMNPGWNGLNYWFDPQNISLTITVTDSGATMNLVNVGLDAPVVSDHTFTYYTTIEQGVSLSYVPYPTGESPFQLPWWGIVAIVGGVLAIYLVGGVIANKCCGDRKCRHPHIHTCLVSFGCVARDKRKALEPEFKGFSVHLPLNWETAVDPATGEPYYYNTVTKEVTWVRPKPE